MGAMPMIVEIRTAELKIRIRPSLKKAIERAASHDQRTVSAWVERLLEEAVKQHATATRRKL
jgi:hypothetical protein